MAIVKLGKIRARRDRPGTYEATYYVNGQRRRASAESREAVSGLVADLLKEAAKESDAPSAWDRNVNLAQYGTTWLEGLEVEPATAKNYRYILEQYVIPFKFDRRRLGDFPVREIRRRHVKALVAHNRRQFSKNTVRVMRCVLSSLLTDAMDDELIEVNPALQLNDRKKRGQIGPDAEIRPMDEAQFRAFIDACESELVYGKEGDGRYNPSIPLTLVLIGKTGLRPSEAIAIASSDVRLDRHTLRIDKVYVSGRIRHYTKTKKRRDVDLTPDLSQHLHRHIAMLREEAFREGQPMPEMLFPSGNGAYLDKDNLRRAFLRLCAKARIGRFRGPYDLRHTYATLLLAAGKPLTYVSSQLGHSKPTTTLAHYAHWLPKEGQGHVDFLDFKDVPEVSEVVRRG